MTDGNQHGKTRRVTLRRGAGFAVVLALLGWAGSTFAVTWALTHRSGARRPEAPLVLEQAARTDLTLTTSDGETLGAWLFPGRADAPAVIVMHGNNGSRGKSRTTIDLLVKNGCTVLAVTLRAHGDSSGDLNDIGWSARKDLVAAVDYLEQHAPGRPIAICGRSMSSAAAIFAAKELGNRVAGYWLEQPYNSLETAAWRRLQQQLPPVCDAVAFTGMRLWGRVLLPVSLAEIAPCQCICDIPEHCPLVILSGDADGNLPLADVQEVFEQVKDRAKLVVFRGAGHIGMPESDLVLYERELDEFLAAVRGRQGSEVEAKVMEGRSVNRPAG
ncbi:MAG TPA: alpha/beta fold hydrolase [Caulifigura sp.]|jgi:pimeloyl-ACP methyl ester carboxylesterase|nr:alpha/beta fold hydrolase [Caulifigura sp.]